ncbi:glycosyltransferase family 2 protein [Algoriphagus hitonicola]|uniref:Glycosyltransferase involved in cell wall bisynthesis n=1 Tax=Algoriphagus hitonicola TaxID=435880 RepID=A0A1I2TG61_9BACT|nr:glycosyltransferase family 2 protein [Algoriphagus hitonicola]SFG63952.1 Glycosyltransferase involved in cell wall bisynthesis [Algoriphagus hitonicola]
MGKFKKDINVSVIIPVYQAKDYLERAVNSVMIQKNVKEIILVEDGSQDGSFELCQRLKATNPLIQLYTHTDRVNKGQASSRNLALKYVTGEWIQFLDADDELLCGKIEGQLNLINENNSFVIGNALDIFLNGRIHKRKYKQNPWVGLISSKLGITSSNLFNAEYVKLVGGFNESLRSSDEYELMFEVLKINDKVVYDSRYLTKIYRTEGSITRSNDRLQKIFQDWVNLRIKIKNHLISKQMFSLHLRYTLYGAIGLFHKEMRIDKKLEFNSIFSYLYQFEKKIKIILYRIFK